jgi:ABC-type transport system involved in multi-copper enzyme maturation permease subunit
MLLKRILQVLAIARTEFRVGLRRGAVVVLTAFIGLVLGAGILLEPVLNMRSGSQFDEFSAEQIRSLDQMGITETIFLSLERDESADSTAISSVQAWLLLYLGLLLLPPATAGCIPADRQFGVLELLRSQPIDGTTYLAGKLLGTLGLVLFVAIFPLLLFFGVLEGMLMITFQHGLPFSLIGFFLRLGLLDGVPILVSGAALGVLVGIAFRSRRTAVFPGLLAGIGALYIWIKAFQAPGVFANGIDRAAAFVFQGYRSRAEAGWDPYIEPGLTLFHLELLGSEAPHVETGQVLLMLAGLLTVLLILAVCARLWLKWKEDF